MTAALHRLGAYLSARDTLATATDLAHRAETLGYDSVWLTHGVGRDGFLVLSAYAHATKRIGLGTGVIPIYPRHPVAMAQEAEAHREKRARLIKAEAELDAAEQLRRAAEVIMQNPAGLELRRMQMITEVGAEQNTTTIVMMPSEFVAMARGIGEMGKTIAEKS